MYKILVVVLAISAYLSPYIGVSPSVYDGLVYNHSITLNNPYYQPVEDLYFVIENIPDYYSYEVVHPDATCDFWDGKLYCEVTKPVQRGTLVIVQTVENILPKIAVCERNLDSYSLPKLVHILALEQYQLFIPAVVR